MHKHTFEQIVATVSLFHEMYDCSPQVIWLSTVDAYTVFRFGLGRLEGSDWCVLGLKALERDGFLGLKVFVDPAPDAMLRVAGSSKDGKSVDILSVD